MCKYCEENKYLMKNDTNGFHTLEVAKDDNDIAYSLLLFTPFGMYDAVINFCPMCGRKLNEEKV